MTQQATFGDTAFEVEIIAMTQELLTSGEIEQIIRRELLKGFERGIESAFQWGDLKKAIDKRITDTMVPYIEKYDMSRHLLKLDEILAELVETSAIGGHRKLLENFRTIMREPENPVITLEELFKRYCKHVEEDVDTSNLEVDTDDEPTYEYVTALAEIVPDDRPWRFDSSYKTAMLYLHIEDSEDLHYAIRLSKFSWDDGWSLNYELEPAIHRMASMSPFETYLTALSHGRVRLADEGGSLEESVQPDARPEATWE